MNKYFENVMENMKNLDEVYQRGNAIDNLFIEIALKFPNKTIKKIEEEYLYKKISKENINIDLIKFSQSFKMNSLKNKIEIKNEIMGLIDALDKKKQDNTLSLESYLNNKYYYVTYKGFLIYLAKEKPELSSYIERIIINNNIRQCKKIVENLFKYLDKEDTKEEIIEIINFYSKLNSKKYDFLLDRILNSMDSNYLREEELFIFKNLLKFLKSEGIRPIKSSNYKFNGKIEDIKDGEYIGTPFKENESKLLEIYLRGWIYGNTIISPVVYREVSNREER